MNNINLRAPLAIALMASALAACENPVSHEDHAEPEGIVIRAGATELVRVEGIGATGQASGLLSIAAGGETPLLTVSFIDHDGEDLTLDPDEYWIDAESADSATATWQGTVAEGFTGRVAGHAIGATTLSFQLHHGAAGGGHAEEGGGPFRVPVSVTVTLQ